METIRCPKCGVSNPTDAAACLYCGDKLGEPREQVEQGRALTVIARWLKWLTVGTVVLPLAALFAIGAGRPFLVPVAPLLAGMPAALLAGLLVLGGLVVLSGVTAITVALRRRRARRPAAPAVEAGPSRHVSPLAVLSVASGGLVWLTSLGVAVIIILAAARHEQPTCVLEESVRAWTRWFRFAALTVAALGVLSAAAARIQVDRHRDALWGDLAARSAVSTAIAAGLLALIVAAVGPSGLNTLSVARKALCSSNIRNIALSLQMYAADNDERFPPAETWCDSIMDYARNPEIFVCSEAPHLPCGYAFNSALSSLALDELADPSNTVLIFDSNAGWNGHGGPEFLPPSPRHLKQDAYALADGKTSFAARGQPDAQEHTEHRWHPR